ncbi:sensor histidine kinase [Piscinibacter sp. XHJ-5]|uniref:sensor histidine kinase n=1 Tax=Piscinibacter sp. XHJ-5 TaxID=3037797 RepID=UPI0024528E5F|nr:sensor histidine kinase [Piscinibacter sp. XHJ-5]
MRVGGSLGVAFCAALIAWCRCAQALDPALDIGQYAHTAWRLSEGFAKGTIGPIAQTPDGYLWLGTDFGLTRFDGVRNVPWLPPAGEALPNSFIRTLLVARDGTLWIGTLSGLASWNGRHLTAYPPLAGRGINALFEDRQGTIWVGTQSTAADGHVCAVRAAGVHCDGQDGTFGPWVAALHEDSHARLWVVAASGLWRWRPGPPQRYPLVGHVPAGIGSQAIDKDGTLLLGTRGGIVRVDDGRVDPLALAGVAGPVLYESLLRDRQGALWIGTEQGLLHLHDGRVDRYALADGLSNDSVHRIFEDREGNIWVSTREGLDRFRELAVTTLTVRQGLSDDWVGAVLSASDGSLWFSTRTGLNRWSEGRMTVYQPRAGRVEALRRVGSLFQDSQGRIWFAGTGEVGYVKDHHVIIAVGVPAGIVDSFAEDSRGNVWIAHRERGLLRWSADRRLDELPWSSLGDAGAATRLAADPAGTGLWLGFATGGIAHVSDGQVLARYATADGLGRGRVHDLRFDRDGALWAATQGGVSRLKNGRVATLDTKGGLPCDPVDWTLEDDARDLWLHTACGLVRIARAEMEAWTAAADQGRIVDRTVPFTVLDSSDGVRPSAAFGSNGPRAAKAADGRLWYTNLAIASIVDPTRLRRNRLPPPVHVEQVIADRQAYAATSDTGQRLRLPPLVRDLQIHYTALSLVAPEKMNFRYKLEGHDGRWQDVGTRRQAFYTDLPPGDYRFTVIASNNDGVWNETGASLAFSVSPAYWQTTWFRTACGAALVAALFMLYRLRLRLLRRRYELRTQDRVGERMRIARELHDTLLQSFQGVLLKFHAVTYMLPDRPEARQKLQGVIEQAEQAIVEGRDAVQALRSSTLFGNELAEGIRALGDELASDEDGQEGPALHVIVEGEPRDLAPLVREEVYRIAREAVRNAWRHAGARRIDMVIRYQRRSLWLSICDDGQGIAADVLNAGRPGHHGLAGMRERALLVHGSLEIHSKPDAGTRVELIIPAAAAYAKRGRGHRWWRA